MFVHSWKVPEVQMAPLENLYCRLWLSRIPSFLTLIFWFFSQKGFAKSLRASPSECSSQKKSCPLLHPYVWSPVLAPVGVTAHRSCSEHTRLNVPPSVGSLNGLNINLASLPGNSRAQYRILTRLEIEKRHVERGVRTSEVLHSIQEDWGGSL